MISADFSTDFSLLAPGSSTVKLTDREWQVATMIATGLSQKKVGNRLGITTKGVSAHVSKIAGRIPGRGKPNFKIRAFILARHAG